MTTQADIGAITRFVNEQNALYISKNPWVLSTRCLYCVDKMALISCGCSNSPMYCSQSCKKLDWLESHKLDCPRGIKGVKRMQPDDIRETSFALINQ